MAFMTESGLDVDMVTGRPINKSPQERAQKAVNRYHKVVQGALDIAAELQAGSPMVRLVYEKCRDRMVFLASQDQQFLALSGIITALRHDLEVAPLLAEDEVRRMLGPQLQQFIQQEETEAAPE